MPPRTCLFLVSSSLSTSPSLRPPVCAQCLHRLQRRQFSSTPQNATRQRQNMFRWLQGPGSVFKNPLPGSTNYLNAYDMDGNLLRLKGKPLPAANDDSTESKDEVAEDSEDAKGKRKPLSEKLLEEQKAARATDAGIPREGPGDLVPFPMNTFYRSHPVLSEELKDEIYKRVVDENKSIRDVSAALGVEMHRVGAVVRLKALEHKWQQEGKPLATPYAQAITAMLPVTRFIPHDPIPHESINDLPVHRATTNQIFHPVSESRHFTRRDAGRIFDPTLLPAEDRIPHPELYEMGRWKAEGVVTGERIERRREANEREAKTKKELARLRKEKEQLTVKKAQTPRWEFRFRNIRVEDAGKDGRGARGVGARYGMPHEDRKKGQVKIPTRVEA